MMGLVPLEEEIGELASSQPTPNEDTGKRLLSSNQEESTSWGTKSADTLILDFPASQIMTNSCR